MCSLGKLKELTVDGSVELSNVVTSSDQDVNSKQMEDSKVVLMDMFTYFLDKLPQVHFTKTLHHIICTLLNFISQQTYKQMYIIDNLALANA